MGKRLLCFLQRFAVVALIPCAAFLVVACGTNATTNPSPPAITSTVKARLSPTPALSEVLPPRKGGSMAYDGTTGMDLLFGGAAGPPYGDLNDTWVWNGQTWRPLHPVTSPPPRNGASMVYDAATGTIVLFGGVSPTGTVLGDTWTWDGSTWTEQHPRTSPRAREATGMAYDAARRTVVLFGGETENGRFPLVLNDTWTWDGTTWAEQHPTTSPPARSGASMASDAATQQVVLFGGGYGYPLNETWTWDGTTWTQQHPIPSPPARSRASMVYDATMQQLVLFGGEGTTVPAALSDTWTWDGTTWTEQPPMPSPGGSYTSAAYDAARQYVLVLTTPGGKFQWRSETWIWTGTMWKKLG